MAHSQVEFCADTQKNELELWHLKCSMFYKLLKNEKQTIKCVFIQFLNRDGKLLYVYIYVYVYGSLNVTI